MDDETKNAIEAATVALASKSWWITSLAAVFGFVSSSQFIAFASLVLGIIGLSANIYFKTRDDKRSREEHEARMKRLLKDSKPMPLEDA